jgi:hypothetical protein
MKTTLMTRMIGSDERRPSASRMPSGSEQMMPVNEITNVTSSPPHSLVSTCGNPNMPPTSRMNASTGNTPKNRIAFKTLCGTLGIRSGASSTTPMA